MADDFTTPSGLQAVYADTLGYDIDDDLAAAHRHAKALRGMIGHVQFSQQGSSQYQWNMAVLRDELRQCLAWIASKQSATESQRLKRPAVLHADFSTFGKYDSTLSGGQGRA